MIPLMTSTEWSDPGVSRFFKLGENWGDPYKLAVPLVSGLVLLREKAGNPIHIHCAFAESGHATNSMHYQGLAADLHIEGLSLPESVMMASKSGFTGIGCYPNWNTPGIHVDCRDLVCKPETCWIEPVKGTGEYTYYPDIGALVNELVDMERKGI